MPKYLIEVPHEKEEVACARAVKIFLETGSHWLTNAEWGCMDGDHRAWMIVDVGNRDEAKAILPPFYRPQARIVQLNRFSLDFIDQILSRHGM
jgi:hypothetical protein